MMRPFLLSLSFVLSLTGMLGSASAEGTDEVFAKMLSSDAQAVLAMADHRASPYTDITMEITMILRGGDDDGKELSMTQYTKEGTKAAIKFRSPADLKGLGIVIKGDNEIYVKLPGSKKVRRVASHARKQGFQGTDFSMDDLKMISFGRHFDAKFLEKSDTGIKLELSRKSSSTVPYKRIVTVIPKDSCIMQSIEYFDDDGIKVKQQERSNLDKDLNGQYGYRTILMKDLIRNHATELRVKEMRGDKKIPSKTFSKRWLIRGT